MDNRLQFDSTLVHDIHFPQMKRCDREAKVTHPHARVSAMGLKCPENLEIIGRSKLYEKGKNL